MALGQDPSARAEGHMYVMICGSGGFRNPLAKAQTGLEESQLVEQLESLGETSGAAGSGGSRGLASSLASCSEACRHPQEPQTPVFSHLTCFSEGL